jgi:hypothetical protein
VKVALAWQAGANFQPDADVWMGKDSATSALNTRISSKCIPFDIGIGRCSAENFKNAGPVHARNWIRSIDAWRSENDLDGLSPPPDEVKLLCLGACGNSSYAYSYFRNMLIGSIPDIPLPSVLASSMIRRIALGSKVQANKAC